MSRTDQNLRDAISRNEKAALCGAAAVVFGLLLEVLFAAAFHEPPETVLSHWGPVAADVIVTLGVVGEIFFGRRERLDSEELTRRSEKRLGEATERAGNALAHAAEADRARVALERQLAARTLNREQFDTIQKLNGKIKSVIVASDVDVEPAWFATVLAHALQKAGIEVGLTTRGAHAHSSANFVCDKRAFINPDGEPTNGEPLVNVLNEAGIPIGGVLAGYPGDLRRGDDDPMDIPMIVIGGRFAVPPSEPYLGAGTMAPPPTMVERMRNP